MTHATGMASEALGSEQTGISRMSTTDYNWPYVVFIGGDLADAPPAFKHFYKSVGRAADEKLRLVNEVLVYEPYDARLECDHHGVWRMEFGSEEDWIQFNLRWA